ncbi:hypothetical protein GQ44DRAFT_723797 [Phaeosphaeriaceae sp. PMI808]|nr:hypothetical protein GQ44DRAFT_723797 [Phaeosphaeriaceae sp. PMI808]
MAIQHFQDYPDNITQLRDQYTSKYLALCRNKLNGLAASVFRKEHDVRLIGYEGESARVSDLSSLRDSLHTPRPWILIRLTGLARQLSISLGMLRYIFTYYDVMPEMVDFLAEFNFQQPTLRSLDFRERRTELDDFQLCYSLVLPILEGESSDRPTTFTQIIIHVQGGPNRLPIWICAESSSKMTACYGDFEEVLRELSDYDRVGNELRLIVDVNGFFGSMADYTWGGFLQASAAEANMTDYLALSDPTTRPTMLLNRIESLIHEASISVSNLGTNIEALRALHEWSERYLGSSRLRTTIQNLETHLKMAGRLEIYLRGKRAMYIEADAHYVSRASLELARDMERLTINILRINYLDRLHLRQRWCSSSFGTDYMILTCRKTFFSTDVVHFTSTTTEYSSTALVRWLQITLPLLAFIFFVLYFSQVWSVKLDLSRQKRMTKLKDPEEEEMPVP